MSGRLYFILIGIVFFIGIESKPLVTSELINRINDLLDLSESKEKYTSIINKSLNNDPNLSAYKNQFMKFFDKFLPYEVLRQRIAEIYSEYYTLSDINELIKFYSSPIGKKVVDTSGKIESQVNQLFEKRLQEQLPQMFEWLQKNIETNIIKV